MSNKYLIEESPIIVLPTLAAAIGLDEAIILQQVHYWLGINRKAGKKEMFIDGKWWTYGSYPRWQKKNFPWWSVSTVKRTFLSLEKQKLLISGQYSPDKTDRSKWYTIDYQALENHDSLTTLDGASGQNEPMDESNLSRSIRSKRADPIKDTKDTLEDNNHAQMRSAMYDAIRQVWGYEAGRNGDVANWLSGKKYKAQYKDYPIDPPLSPDELLSWSNDWRSKHPDIDMVASPAKVQDSILQWRREQFKPQGSSRARELIEEQHRFQREQFGIGAEYDGLIEF